MKPVLNLIVLITNDRKCQKMFDKEYYKSTREKDNDVMMDRDQKALTHYYDHPPLTEELLLFPSKSLPGSACKNCHIWKIRMIYCMEWKQNPAWNFNYLCEVTG